MDLDYILKLGGGGVSFVGIVYGIVLFFTKKSEQTSPESLAKARTLNVTAEIDLIDQYKKYVEELERRMDTLEARYEKKIVEKDDEINNLYKRVRILEDKLSKYEKLA